MLMLFIAVCYHPPPPPNIGGGVGNSPVGVALFISFIFYLFNYRGVPSFQSGGLSAIALITFGAAAPIPNVLAQAKRSLSLSRCFGRVDGAKSARRERVLLPFSL
jgi:hypothetical protein